MRSTFLRWATPGACAAALLVAATASCKKDPTQVELDLDAVRQATAPFADAAAATAAGYTTELTACMSDAQGGMGYHTGNTGLIDGTVQLEHPEVVMYEPQAGGSRTMVGVEYLVPYTAVPSAGPAPTIMGQTFKRNDAFQVWALHAWIHRDNPNGVFTDWNPSVSCANAPAVHSGGH